jgi:hypothetical protein
MTSVGFTLTSVHDDPATAMAATGFSRMVRERQLQRYPLELPSASAPDEDGDAAR